MLFRSKDQEIRLPNDGVHKKRHVLNQRKREMLGGIIKLKVVIKDIYCIKRIKRSLKKRKNCIKLKRKRTYVEEEISMEKFSSISKKNLWVPLSCCWGSLFIHICLSLGTVVLCFRLPIEYFYFPSNTIPEIVIGWNKNKILVKKLIISYLRFCSCGGV